MAIMKWRPKNIRETAFPLLALNWLMGLGLNDYPVGNRRNKLFLIAVIIIAIIYSVQSPLYIILQCHGGVKSLFLIRKVMYFLEAFIAVFAIIHGWFYRKRMCLLTESMEALNETFKCLAFKENYVKNFKELLYWIIVYLILFTTSHVINIHLWKMKLLPVDYFYVCSFIVNWPYYTTTVVDLSFNFTLKFIERKLKILNFMLKSNFGTSLEKSFFDDYVNRRLFISIASTDKISEMSIKRNEQHLEIIKHIHLELYNLKSNINEIYGKHLLLQITLNFCCFTIWSFGLVLYFIKNYYLAAIFILLRITTSAMRFLHVIVPCCLITKETEKMKVILTDVKNIRKNVLLTEEIEHFYQQICLLPFNFTICKFHTLGIVFLMQFLGSILSYVFILVQFRLNLD